MDIEVTREFIDEHDVLTPHGDVDLATVETLRDAMADLLAAGRSNLVIDLARTTFLDSTALGCLIGARGKALDGGGSFLLLVDDAPLLRLLAITKLDHVFEILPDRDAWLGARSN